MARKLPGEVRREQIGDAALSISSESGVRAVTVAEVAKRMGVAPSALYRHVESREGILILAMERLSEMMLEAMNEARAAFDDPLDILEMYLFRLLEYVLGGLVSPRILFSDEVFSGTEDRPSTALRFFREFQGQLVPLFAEGQRKGVVRTDIEPRRLGIMFVGLYSPPIILYHATLKKFDITTQIRTGWKLFRQSLDPKNGEPGSRDGMKEGGDIPAT